MSKAQAPKSTPSPAKGEVKTNLDAADQRSLFMSAFLDMSWQLAVVVLLPILLGVWLDKVLKTGEVFVLVGLGLAVAGSIIVIWRSVQTANRLPVPKLTAAQKKAIKKTYEEDEDT